MIIFVESFQLTQRLLEMNGKQTLQGHANVPKHDAPKNIGTDGTLDGTESLASQTSYIRYWGAFKKRSG